MASNQQPDISPEVKNLSIGRRISLVNQKPISLPPYTQDQAFLNSALDSVAPTIRQDVKPFDSEIVTEYKGRRAEKINQGLTQPQRLPGNSEYAYPINTYEDGELVRFAVITNDPDIKVTCILYDDKDRPDPLCNESAKDLVIQGRGLTQGQAEAVDFLGVSLDNKGEHHPVMPFVLRYKNTFSQGFTDPADYDAVEGTPNDKFYVIEFAPSIPAPYKRIYFQIQNNTANTRVIHSWNVRRYAFVDEFVTSIKPKKNGNGKANGSGNGNANENLLVPGEEGLQNIINQQNALISE